MTASATLPPSDHCALDALDASDDARRPERRDHRVHALGIDLARELTEHVETRDHAALIRALTDPDPAVREHAADALGHLGTPDADAAAPALLGLVADPEPTVRVAAVAALGQLGDSADAALAEIASGTGTQAALAVRLMPQSAYEETA